MASILGNVRLEGSYPRREKLSMYVKSIASTNLNGEKLYTALLKSGMRHGWPLFSFLYFLNKVLDQKVKQEKEIRKQKGTNGKEFKLITICRWHDSNH